MNHVTVVTRRISSLGLRSCATTPQKPNLTCLSYSGSRCGISHVVFDLNRTLSSAIQRRSSQLSCAGKGPIVRQFFPGRQELEKPAFSSSRAIAWPNRSISVRRHQSTESRPPKGVTRPAKNARPTQARGFPPDKIAQIFGPQLPTAVGNNLLRTIQRQRITGTLDKEVTIANVGEDDVARALAWLRTNHPMDEDGAIMKRFDREEEEQEAEYQSTADEYVSRAVKLGIYKPQQNAHKTGVYGKSHLEALRAGNIEKQRLKDEADAEAEAARLKEAEEAHTTALKDSSMIHQPEQRAVLARRSETAAWIHHYHEKAKLSNLDNPPVMSRTARLLPSTIFATVVILLCVWFADNYVPPMRSARLLPHIHPAAATIMTIIALNTLAIVMWRIPPMWLAMNKYFLLIPATPRAISLLGNTFSHQTGWHLLGNMALLWFLGVRFHDDIGRGNFVALYIASGVFASWVSLTRIVLMKAFTITSLGASGALCGILAGWCHYHSGEHFQFKFIPADLSPLLSSNLILLACVVFEIVGIARGGNRKIDQWSHLGGYAAGVVGVEALRRKERRWRGVGMERAWWDRGGKGKI